MKAKDRRYAGAVPDEGRVAINRDDADVVAFFRRHLMETAKP